MAIRLIFCGFIFIASIFCVNTGYSQSNEGIVFTAKLNVIDFKNLTIAEDDLVKIPLLLKDDRICQLDTLTSKGFDKTIFFSIKFADLQFSEILKSGIIPDETDLIYSHFVLAYSLNRSRFYNISGFVQNEFSSFFFDYKLSAGVNEKELLSDGKKFEQSYFVDFIDLNCFYKTLKAKNHSPKNYPCLKPVDTRQLIIRGVPFDY